MRVHVYSLCWNEHRMLPYYFRHYRPVAERFFILDDGSTDGSDLMLESQPDADLGRFSKEPESFVLSARRFYNEGWKRSRGQADWVVGGNGPGSGGRQLRPGAVEAGVDAPGLDQLVVGSGLDDPALVEDGDPVGVHNRRKPVGDHYRGAVGEQLA
jgi:hypothetical protein